MGGWGAGATVSVCVVVGGEEEVGGPEWGRWCGQVRGEVCALAAVEDHGGPGGGLGGGVEEGGEDGGVGEDELVEERVLLGSGMADRLRR